MGKTIAIIGGDRRQVCLARLLLREGRCVVTWGLEQGNAPNPVPLDRALAAEIVVLPLPVCRDGGLLLPLTEESVPVERLLNGLKPAQLVFGGMTQTLDGAGVELLDYFARESFQIANAVPSAEGAIQLAMAETEHTIQGSRCLVLGYGRIGRALSQRLLALGAAVTASARKETDLAWIRAAGCASLHSGGLSGRLAEFDLIFNTVPARLLDSAALAETAEHCVLVELASPPGGFDYAGAAAMGRKVVRASGLPGRVAPQTAAAAIWDSIGHILEERGESI